MVSLRTFALACALTAIAVTPASADWQGMGRADFGTGMRHRAVPGLERPVRALTFTARNNPMVCDTIRARFESGREVEVYSGRLPQGRPVHVDLPGGRHRIERLNLRCRATHHTAFVEISADTADRDERRDDDRGWGGGSSHRDHDWGGNWGHRDHDADRGDFGGPRYGGRGVAQPEDWYLWRRLGEESFERHNDREVAFAGRAGHRVTALALRPEGDDAHCRRAMVTYFSGNTFPLPVDRMGRMERGLFYVFDVPGDAATVRRISLVCRAAGDRDVRIEIYAKGRD